MISAASWVLQESVSYLCQTAIIGAYADSAMRQAVVTNACGEFFKIGLMRPRVSSNLTAICGY